VIRKKTNSKKITGFEIHKISRQHKLSSMKFQDRKTFFVDLARLQLKFAVAVADWGVSYATSLTGYRNNFVLCVQP